MSDPGVHAVSEAVDPVVDLAVPRRLMRLWRGPWATLGAISAGGMIGALARYQISAAFPHSAGSFGWATWAINVTGCLLIAILMVATTEVRPAHRLVRLFLGGGVLGGFTTFATSIVEAQQAVEAGAARTGLVYLAATVAGALAAIFAGAQVTRLLARAVRRLRKARSRS